jgi:hypothetical protein
MPAKLSLSLVHCSHCIPSLDSERPRTENLDLSPTRGESLFSDSSFGDSDLPRQASKSSFLVYYVFSAFNYRELEFKFDNRLILIVIVTPNYFENMSAKRLCRRKACGESPCRRNVQHPRIAVGPTHRDACE